MTSLACIPAETEPGTDIEPVLPPAAPLVTGEPAVSAQDGAGEPEELVVVDVPARRARVRTGARWAHVIAAAAPHGLAAVCADSSAVDVVEHVLGGGLGPMARRYGPAAGHARPVGADAVELDLVELGAFYGGGLYFTAEHAPTVLRAYRGWTAGLPERMCTSLALLRLPDSGELPDSLRKGFVTHVRVVYLGAADEGAELLAPMRAAAPALVDDVSWRPYTEIDTVHREPDDPAPVRGRGVRLDELTEEAVERVLAAAGPQVKVPLPMVELRHLAGAAFALYVAGDGAPGLAPLVDAVTERVLGES